ncbi:MAG: DUF192 domain-containing protein [Myxococcales bacterium]|nr:DUF192 domain-containing protein [Myxococcales bacterium]MDH5307660.1 DUF192 domain-containing protein [Myxococcales bacterium]MDH5566776.1 DUF192 domain-containing protein [Myxococcales bacterium]
MRQLRLCWLACGIVLPLALIACGDSPAASRGSDALPVVSILVGQQRAVVEVAATPETRRVGLMHRESLPEERGMLFVFPQDRVLSFWMKDTRIPLSIAFARSDGVIVQIADMEPFSERSISSRGPVRYALEMNRGWFSRHGVVEGDSMRRMPRIRAE